GTDRLLDRDVAIAPMLIPQVDVPDAEPLERAVDCAAHVLRSPVDAGHPAVLNPEAELGRADRAITMPGEAATEELLVRVGSVDLGRVEEIHAEVECAMDRRNRLRVVRRPVHVTHAGDAGHAHRAEADGGDFEPLCAELAQ